MFKRNESEGGRGGRDPVRAIGRDRQHNYLRLKFAELLPRSAASPSATYARKEAGTSAIFYFFLALMDFPASVTCWCGLAKKKLANTLFT